MSAFIQTSFKAHYRRFLVSTMNRESSAVAAQGMVYAETLAWEVLPEGNKLLGMKDSARDSIVGHVCMVTRLFKTGKADDDEAGS